jgi:hypothetical protein
VRPLSSYRVQRVEPAGINYEPPSAQIVVWGIHEGSEHVTGIRFGDTLLQRAPGELVEALRIRAMREVVPSLPANALRDPNGKAVGYLTYAGLPVDHCVVTPQRLAGL